MKKLIPFLFSLSILGSVFAQQNLNPVFNWEDPTLVASNFHNNTYNEVWGVKENGREYAIIGTTEGTHIFDVTDTTNIYKAELIPGAVQGGIVVHRDYHDYLRRTQCSGRAIGSSRNTRCGIAHSRQRGKTAQN
jgi:hypothetical protein